MSKQNDEELDDIEMMSLELDDGTKLECEIVATFDVEDTSYIALLPIEAPEGYDDDEVLVYRYIELPNDEFTLEPIEDEEEFDIVADAFDEILDEMEFNSMSEDDQLSSDMVTRLFLIVYSILNVFVIWSFSK